MAPGGGGAKGKSPTAAGAKPAASAGASCTRQPSEKDGVSVLVDPKSMTLVRGTTLDFETGIRGHGFKFENPNVSDECGCGESVSF